MIGRGESYIITGWWTLHLFLSLSLYFTPLVLKIQHEQERSLRFQTFPMIIGITSMLT